MQEWGNQEVTIVGELEKECLCVHDVSHSPIIVNSRPTLPHKAYSLPFIHRTLFSFCTMRYLLLILISNIPICERAKIIQIFNRCNISISYNNLPMRVNQKRIKKIKKMYMKFFIDLNSNHCAWINAVHTHTLIDLHTHLNANISFPSFSHRTNM